MSLSDSELPRDRNGRWRDSGGENLGTRSRRPELRVTEGTWSELEPLLSGGHFIPGCHYNPSRCDGHRDGLRHASDRGTSESEVGRLSRGPRMHGHGPFPWLRPQCRPGGPRTITQWQPESLAGCPQQGAGTPVPAAAPVPDLPGDEGGTRVQSLTCPGPRGPRPGRHGPRAPSPICRGRGPYPVPGPHRGVCDLARRLQACYIP